MRDRELCAGVPALVTDLASGSVELAEPSAWLVAENRVVPPFVWLPASVSVLELGTLNRSSALAVVTIVALDAVVVSVLPLFAAEVLTICLLRSTR